MTTKRTHIRAAFIATSLLLFADRAGAASRELGLPELVGLAQEIVVGRVLDSKARWQGRLIVTSTVVRVDEALKGRPATKIKVTQLGGTAFHPRLGAPVTMTASTYTELRPGERVLLFLEQQRPGLRGLVGAQQGKLVVRDEPATGKSMLPVGPKQFRVAREDAHTTVASETMTLDAMRDHIRALVAGGTR